MLSPRLRRRLACALLALFCAGGVVAPAWHGVEHAVETARAVHGHAEADGPHLGAACPAFAAHGTDCFLCQRAHWMRVRPAHTPSVLERTERNDAPAVPIAARHVGRSAAPRAPPHAA